VSAPGTQDAVRHALEATLHAEELHRQAAQQQAAQQQIDAMPGLSQHKRDLLRAHPQMFFDPATRQATDAAYRAALADGVPDDTPEMSERIIEGVRREAELRHQRGIDAAHAAMPAGVPSMREPTIEHSAQRLEQEAGAIRSAMAAETATPMAVMENMENLPAPAPRRQSIPMSAPVSRDVPTASGRRMSEQRSVTLTEEERDIARRSYSAPDMTNDEKERAYAAAKLRLNRLRARGEYPEPERN
jgi:hypothetical protein